MKKLLLSLAALVLIISPAAFTSCDIVTASGETQTLEFDYTNFSRLEVSMGFNVFLTQGDEYSVSLLIDKSLYEYLMIDQRGDTLYIGLKTNRTYTGAAVRSAIIGLPDLRRLELSGGSTSLVDMFILDHDIDFIVSGASSVAIQETQANDASFTLSGGSEVNAGITINNGNLDISGASKITLNGSAGDLRLKADGGSVLTLDEFPVTTARVEMDGGSQATISISDILNVKLKGGSVLNYNGSPKLGGMEISGGAKLNQVNP